MKTKKFPTEVWLETFVLRDKKSLFRASAPDQYIVQVMAKGAHGIVILRELRSPDHAAMMSTYRSLRNLFE